MLTNGVNVGGRAGTPSAPGAVALERDLQAPRPAADRDSVCKSSIAPPPGTSVSGSLTLPANKVHLVRVGGEGGRARQRGPVEGANSPRASWNVRPQVRRRRNPASTIRPRGCRCGHPGQLSGRQCVDPVDAGLPTARCGGVGGGPCAKLPTVPVMHLEVTADPAVSARLHDCRRPQRRRRHCAAGQGRVSWSARG